MSIELSLSAADLETNELQELGESLCRDLKNEAGLDASFAKTTAPAGTKGDWELIGQIVLKGLGAVGGGAALLNVVKTYLQNRPSLEIEVNAKEGKFKLTGKGMSQSERETAFESLRKLAEGKPLVGEEETKE